MTTMVSTLLELTAALTLQPLVVARPDSVGLVAPVAQWGTPQVRCAAISEGLQKRKEAPCGASSKDRIEPRSIMAGGSR
jgi:hypothetical protein